MSQEQKPSSRSVGDQESRSSPGLGLKFPLASAARLWNNLVNRQEFVPVILFIAVAIFLTLGTDTFLSGQNLTNVSRNLWIAVVAFGQSMVIIIGGIDLSVGATMALSGLVAAVCMQHGLPVPLAIAAGLLVGVIVGCVNGIIVARVQLPPFIVTLGTMSIARGLTNGLTSGWSLFGLPTSFLLIGQHNIPVGSWSLPLPTVITLGIALLVSLFLNQTVIGGYIYAMSSGERALLVSGVNVVQLKILVYTICGLLAAVGGLLMTAHLGVASPTATLGYEVYVVGAAVIGGTSLSGGTGSTLGMLLGAAITQMLSNGLISLGLPSYWQTVSIGALVLIAILLDYWWRRR